MERVEESKNTNGIYEARKRLQELMKSDGQLITKDGGQAPNIQWVLITPELASAMLERNCGNRTLREKYVCGIRNDLMADRWIFAANVISFYNDGMLSDGQHRLAAIASSGKSVYSLVAFGLKREAALYIDCGRKRSAVESIRTFEWGEKFSKEK